MPYFGRCHTNSNRHRLDEEQNSLDGIRNAIYRGKLYWFYGNLFAGSRTGDTQQARPAALEWMLGASG